MNDLALELAGAYARVGEVQFNPSLANLGDTAGARTAYQDVLAQWKDADPDLPPLIAAKAEYSKLQ